MTTKLATTRLMINVPGHRCLRCGSPAADFDWPLTINKRSPEYCASCGRWMVEMFCSRMGADPAPWLRGLPAVTPRKEG